MTSFGGQGSSAKMTSLGGPGKSMYPLSTNANILSATLRFLQKYVRPYYDISMGVTLVCYQQAGSDGKYIGVSGKWVC